MCQVPTGHDIDFGGRDTSSISVPVLPHILQVEREGGREGGREGERETERKREIIQRN